MDNENSGYTLDQVCKFLLGEGEMDGFWFGDSHTARPRPAFWWRNHLRAALAATPAMPEAASEPESYQFYDEDTEKWCHLINERHHKATEAAGYKIRPLYAAQQPSPAPSDAWLTTAHMICTDAGVPQGHIQHRLEALRALVPSPAPAVAGEAMQGQEIDAAIYNFTGISKSQFQDEYSELRNLADYLLAAPQGEKQ